MSNANCYTNASSPAYPLAENVTGGSGLTKRELFAAMAMQGFASIPHVALMDDEDRSITARAARAVIWADALLDALATDSVSDEERA